jgi:pimeloyl-ACP methyl ester carboxylesterase
VSRQFVEREHRWTSKDGLELYARSYDGAGAGAPTVMCLPGLTRNSLDFEDLADHLSPRYRVICPDLRGRGRSARDPVWQNYHPGTYVGDLMLLIAGLGLKRLAIVGTSLGGLLGMILPTVLPTAIAGVVLNDVGPEVDPVGIERIRGYAGRLPPVRDWAGAVAQLKVVFGAAWPDLSEAAWARVVRRSYSEDSAGVPVAAADPMIGEAFRAAPSTSTDLWPLWASLAATPMLAIRGGLSDILSAPTLERMQREHPGLTALTVANRGHTPMLDEPECVRAIDDFLGRLRW